MMSRTYHLLVLPIFTGFLALGMTLALDVATSLVRTATTTTTY